MKNITATLFILSLGFISAVHAEDSQSSLSTSRTEAPTEASRATWKGGANTSFFDYAGNHAANGDAYTFGNIHILAQNLELAYMPDTATKIFVRGKYLDNSWEVIAGGGKFAERTEGMGDTLLGASHPLIANPVFQLVADGGFYLPTGSIDQANAYVPGQRYKYFLQLGSGTIDETAGLTALTNLQPVKLGTRASTVLRNGHNANGYQVGNVFRADSWADLPVGYGFTPRLVGWYRLVRPMEGQDDKVNRQAAEFYYHDQVDWAVAAALKYEQALAKAVSLNAELGVPVFQGWKNSDSVTLTLKYYANLSLIGQF